MKTLIIAEKPSVAADIAHVIKHLARKGDHYEGEEYIVASSVGHLLELTCPKELKAKGGKWSLANLPVLPERFDLKPIAKTADRLKSLTRLLARRDVDLVVNACDAGREGELIFRYIMQATDCHKDSKRLWLQSMTPAAISDALDSLRSDEEMLPLAAAARSRSEADWLVGINGTRAMTALNSGQGGFALTTVGRVQTPTLAIVTRRENEIQAFQPSDYWEIRADFEAGEARWQGRWFDPDFIKDAADPEARAERIFDKERARAIMARCRGGTGAIEESSKRESKFSPPLFDLTSLQREANSRFGYSAKTTLALAQSLYERHKALTYPRTDSRALPQDYVAHAREVVETLRDFPGLAPWVERVQSNDWVQPTRRIFDNSRISDHFAIIPTRQLPGTRLSEAEAKIYDLVARRFLAVFFPPCEQDITTRVVTIGEDRFKAEGKVMVKAGWREIYGRIRGQGDELPALGAERQATVGEMSCEKLTTKPPARYNEATLLGAMEGAGKLVDDSELRAAMAQRGLGTPATRAAIIENLLDQAYMVRDGRELRPTAKAQDLMALLEKLGLSELSDPGLTGEWEYKLARVERNELSREEFMGEIRGMTEKIVSAIKSEAGADKSRLDHLCPRCGGEMVERLREFACATSGCKFRISRRLAGRDLTSEEVEELLENGRLGPLTGFTSHLGRPFAATLVLDKEKGVSFEFVPRQRPTEKQETEESEDPAALPMIGTCPKCGGRVRAGARFYFCEGKEDKHCDFRLGNVILSQPVSHEQAAKIISEGRSDLLDGFVSKRTQRSFKAYLKLDEDGKVGFEFEPRITPRRTRVARSRQARDDD